MRAVKSRFAVALLFGYGAWMSGVQAEGAVRVLDCAIERSCDALANCEPGSGRVGFRLEPLELDADGAGTYRIAYRDVETDMRALSEAGPFVWNEDADRHTLLFSSEELLLWHRLRLQGAPEATLTVLRCAYSR